jgi:aldose 1-epimerase
MAEASVSSHTIQAGSLRVVVITYGATITEVHVPDKDGNAGDVVLGFNSINGWMSDECPSMNCCVGRTAGRNAAPGIAVDGVDWPLPGCDGGGGKIDTDTNLHGGFVWQKANWAVAESGDDFISLQYTEHEKPWPGDVTCIVTYRVRECDRQGGGATELVMEYTATTTATTPVSFTNHAYWNLSAAGGTTVEDHTLQVLAETYSPDNGSGNGVPTGERRALEGTGSHNPLGI